MSRAGIGVDDDHVSWMMRSQQIDEKAEKAPRRLLACNDGVSVTQGVGHGSWHPVVILAE